MNTDIIELTLSEGTELDFQIALVDSPAIESDFMAFKKAQHDTGRCSTDKGCSRLRQSLESL